MRRPAWQTPRENRAERCFQPVRTVWQVSREGREKSGHGHRWLVAGGVRSSDTTGRVPYGADGVRAAEGRPLPANGYFVRGLAGDCGLRVAHRALLGLRRGLLARGGLAIIVMIGPAAVGHTSHPLPLVLKSWFTLR